MQGQAAAITIANSIRTLIPRDDATILGLANAGHSCQDIANLTGVHKATIARQLKHLRPRKSTQVYKDLRADILAELQRKILGKCDLRTLKIGDAKDLKDATLAYGILYDKERLERGQATAIQDYRGLSVQLSGSIEDARRALAMISRDKMVEGIGDAG